MSHVRARWQGCSRSFESGASDRAFTSFYGNGETKFPSLFGFISICYTGIRARRDVNSYPSFRGLNQVVIRVCDDVGMRAVQFRRLDG